jgi:hypothetical protein
MGVACGGATGMHRRQPLHGVLRGRYSEGHAELEGLRSMHSRVVEQLEATHGALEAEQKARFHSEDEAGRLRMDVQQLKALQESLALER